MSEFKKAKSVLVANNKGGVGKSTLTVTIAVGLMRQGYKVLVIDADPQQSVGRWRLAASGEEHEKDLPWVERVDTPMVGEKIQLERGNYDYIITDTASNIGFKGDVAQKILISAIKNADHIIVPIGASPLDVDGSEDLFDVLKDIWERRDGRYPPATVVINAVKPGTSLGRDVGAHVAERFDVPVMETIITQRESFKRAFFRGESVFSLGEKKTVDEATQLVKEVIAITQDNNK